jgi:hypothetical protein
MSSLLLFVFLQYQSTGALTYVLPAAIKGVQSSSAELLAKATTALSQKYKSAHKWK